MPIRQGSEFVLPGILKLTSGNAGRYFDDLFDPTFVRNANDPAQLKRNLAEMYGGLKTAFDHLDFTAHHLIPGSLRNHKLLQRIGFNVDAAINAFPIMRGAHGWSRPHSAYNRAVEDILDLIRQTGRSVEQQREMVLETMARASSTILDGNALRNGVGALSQNDWLTRLKPVGL